MKVSKMTVVMLCAFLALSGLAFGQVGGKEPPLNCEATFRILDLKQNVSFNPHPLDPKPVFQRRISRLTVEIVKLNITDEQKKESPLAVKWLNANAREVDFSNILLNSAQEEKLREAYRQDRKQTFTFLIQVVSNIKNGGVSCYVHLMPNTSGEIIWR